MCGDLQRVSSGRVHQAASQKRTIIAIIGKLSPILACELAIGVPLGLDLRIQDGLGPLGTQLVVAGAGRERHEMEVKRCIIGLHYKSWCLEHSRLDYKGAIIDYTP